MDTMVVWAERIHRHRENAMQIPSRGAMEVRFQSNVDLFVMRFDFERKNGKQKDLIASLVPMLSA